MFFLISFWESVKYDGAFYGILAFFILAVIIVTWLYARTRSAQTIAELKTQLLQMQTQYTDRISVLEDEYKAKFEHTRLILQDMQLQLQKADAAMLLARRNELINFFVLEYSKSVRHYARVVEPFLSESRFRYQQFLENHILPFLQHTGDVLEVVNQPKVLSTSGAQPLQLFYPDFDFAFDLLRHHIGIWDFGLRKARNQHALRLGFSKEI